MATKILTVERLRQVLQYLPETGEFLALEDSYKCTRRKGTVLSGSLGLRGYYVISVDGKQRTAHRLAFLLMTGESPPEVDHINGIRTDNRWCNLRAADRGMNARNKRKAHIDKKSHPLLGVYRNKKRWMSQIMTNGERVYLGTYDTPEEAHQVYLEAKRIHHADGCTI